MKETARQRSDSYNPVLSRTLGPAHTTITTITTINTINTITTTTWSATPQMRGRARSIRARIQGRNDPE